EELMGGQLVAWQAPGVVDAAVRLEGGKSDHAAVVFGEEPAAARPAHVVNRQPPKAGQLGGRDVVHRRLVIGVPRQTVANNHRPSPTRPTGLGPNGSGKKTYRGNGCPGRSRPPSVQGEGQESAVCR